GLSLRVLELVREPGDALLELGRVDAQQTGQPALPGPQLAQVVDGGGAHAGLDAPYAGGDRLLGGDDERADRARAVDVGTAAQLDGDRVAVPHGHHAYLGAVLLAEEHHGAGVAGLGQWDHAPRDL